MKKSEIVRELDRKEQIAKLLSQARKRRGLSQEELADLTHLTVRTIQRIENGKTDPRPYTLRTMATVLDISLEDMQSAHINAPYPDAFVDVGQVTHDLKLFCLSCFSYLLIPFVHFALPYYLSTRMKGLPASILAYAQKVVRGQIYWLLTLHLSLLATVAFNFLCAAYFRPSYNLHYLVPALIMYFVNAIVIVRAFAKFKSLVSKIEQSSFRQSRPNVG